MRDLRWDLVQKPMGHFFEGDDVGPFPPFPILFVHLSLSIYIYYIFYPDLFYFVLFCFL